jgi:hypothetical protein
MVDWRYIRGGFVGWYAGNERIGVWEPAPAHTRGEPNAPYGLHLASQPAETLGPTFPQDKPWEYSCQIHTLLYEEGVYRAWYECVPDDHFKGQQLAWPTGHGNLLCYAESDDGFTWRKPNLGIASYHSISNTNIVYGRELSPNGMHGSGVFKDPSAPAAERYKLIYMATATEADQDAWIAAHRSRFGNEMDPMCFRKTTTGRQLLGMSGHLDRDMRSTIYWIAGAVSPDGIAWTPIPESLMIHFSDSVNTCYWDESRRKYVGYFRTWRYGRRCVGRAETDDFRYWPSTPITILTAPLDRHPSDDVYTNGRTLYPGSDSTHLMFPAIYHRIDDCREVYLASSEDGVNWQWVPGGPTVTRGRLGEWNGSDVVVNPGLVPLDGDRVAAPLTGYVHAHKYPRGSEPFGKVGWAVWPKERLCAIEAQEVGEFTTPELFLERGELRLNVKTVEAGAIWVELRDASGQAITGHTFADSDAITGDNPTARASWQGNACLGELANQPLSLAFRLRMASLFAFEGV